MASGVLQRCFYYKMQLFSIKELKTKVREALRLEQMMAQILEI
jgi:hypothetical protein